MLKYNDLFDDATSNVEEDVKKFTKIMKTVESHIVSIQLGKVVIAVPSKYYPVEKEDSYISSFNATLSQYFMKNLGWNNARIDTFSSTSYVRITLVMTDGIFGPLGGYEISCPDHDFCPHVLVAERLKADKWFPEFSNSDIPSKTYDYIISDLEGHLTQLDDNHVTLTSMYGFGAICAFALYDAYKKEFPFVAVGKDEFDNCEITLASRSLGKEEGKFIDGVSAHGFTLPYAAKKNIIDKNIYI